MDSKYYMLALGAVIGGLATMVVAMPSMVPRAMADEPPLKSMYEARDAVVDVFGGERKLDLVKPNWVVDDSVSTEVISSQVIRKIEYGRVSNVTIATTSTGVYSSDAMDSVHIKYPGIEKVSRKGAGVLAELHGTKWTPIVSFDAGSFVSVVPLRDGQLVVTGDGACVFTSSYAYC